MNKVYFPKNEKELFIICGSKDGLVIPLRDFGYPNIHITFYIKQNKINKKIKQINIHLTDEISGLRLYEKNADLDEENIKICFSNCFKELKNVVSFYQRKFKKISYSSKNLFCTECVGKNLIPNLDMKTREKAKKSYINLFNFLGNIDDSFFINNVVNCNDNKHIIFYDILTKRTYYRICDSFVTQKDANKYTQALENVFNKEFSKALSIVDKIIQDIKHILKNSTNS